MEIADSLGGNLTCGAKTKETDGVKNVSDDELEDIIEPDIDVGTYSYDDIAVDEPENNNSIKTEIIKQKLEKLKHESEVKSSIPLFSGFLIDQLIGKK